MTCMLKEQDFGGTFMVNLLEASFCFCFVLFCFVGREGAVVLHLSVSCG